VLYKINKMIKYLFIYFFIVLFASCKTNTIYLDSKYIPEKEYLETTTVIIEKGDTAIGLLSNYVRPNISRDSQVYKYLIKTGKKKVNEFSLSFNELNVEQTEDTVEQISYGWVKKDGIVELDSVMVGDYDLDESWKNEVIEINENILNIRFPFKGKVSIGDTIKIKSFKDFYLTPDIYFFELELDEILKLMYIKDGIAYFDIQYDFSFSPVDSKYDRRLSYMGKGRAEYDIKNSLFVKYSSESMIDYTYKYKEKFYESYSKQYYKEINNIKDQ